MSEDTELMRQFLIILANGNPGGTIRLHIGSLDLVDPKIRLEFHRDGPIMEMSLKIVKDEWGRELDRCGQVKCLKCDTWINFEYADGSKRECCVEHE